MALEVLRCASCGAPVALGAGDEAACGQCGGRTKIPAEHRALRDASGWDAQTRRAAEAALHTFDAPPGLLMRVVAWFAGWPFAAVFMLFGVPLFFFDLVVAFKLANLLCRALGLPHGNLDAIPVDLLSVTMGVVLWVMTVVPAYLAAYGGRRVTARRVLLAALAARPPVYPGGPAGCRGCGAPLSVEAGALVARCLYCRAENAVRLTADELADRHRSTQQIGDTMQQAAARDRQERQATRDAIRRRIWRASKLVVIGTVLWTVTIREFEHAGDEAPALGLLAAVGMTVFLIYLMATSGSSDK